LLDGAGCGLGVPNKLLEDVKAWFKFPKMVLVGALCVFEAPKKGFVGVGFGAGSAKRLFAGVADCWLWLPKMPFVVVVRGFKFEKTLLEPVDC
jgi:hypothetical protein